MNTERKTSRGICLYCNAEFTTYRTDAKFCCSKHRAAYHAVKVFVNGGTIIKKEVGTENIVENKQPIKDFTLAILPKRDFLYNQVSISKIRKDNIKCFECKRHLDNDDYYYEKEITKKDKGGYVEDGIIVAICKDCI